MRTGRHGISPVYDHHVCSVGCVVSHLPSFSVDLGLSSTESLTTFPTRSLATVPDSSLYLPSPFLYHPFVPCLSLSLISTSTHASSSRATSAPSAHHSRYPARRPLRRLVIKADTLIVTQSAVPLGPQPISSGSASHRRAVSIHRHYTPLQLSPLPHPRV